MDADARIEALETKVDLLRAEVARLEQVLGVTLECPLELGLTSQEARLLGVLMKRDVATKDTLMAGIYRDSGKDEPEIKIVDVFVCKIRKKLKPFGLSIETVWGVGYRLPGECKAVVRAMLEAQARVAA